MSPKSQHPTRWKSGVKTISKSAQHDDMWIVSFPDGGWFSLSSDYTTIVISNPPTND